MARYYFTQTAAPYSPATIRGTWDATASMPDKLISTTKYGSADGVGIAIGSTGANYRRALHRFISEALAADKVVSLTEFAAAAYTNNAGLNGYARMHAYMTAGDSDTVRGVLVDNWTSALLFTAATATCGVRGSPTNAPVSALLGDRVVVILGVSASSTSTAYTGRYYRGNNGTTDCTTGGAYTAAGWVDLTLADPAIPTGFMTLNSKFW